MEALEDIADLLGADAGSGWAVEAAPRRGDRRGGQAASGSANAAGADDGWSVEAVAGSRGVADYASDEEEGEEGDSDYELDSDEDEDWGPDEVDAAAGAPGAAPPAPTFGGRVVGKAEQQVLASLPRHLVRRLEAEQLEANAGRRGGVGQAVGTLDAFCWPYKLLAPLPAACSLPCRRPQAERAKLKPAALKKGGSAAQDAPAGAAYHLWQRGGAAPALAAGRPGAPAAAAPGAGAVLGAGTVQVLPPLFARRMALFLPPPIHTQTLSVSHRRAP